ncbi:GH36-type glycosyl hydrolase domain-containing protein [Chlamydiota bacterium]
MNPQEDKTFYHTKYGYFDNYGKEYVIVTPDTPRPWVNVMCNGRYGLTLSQTGGGFSWLDNPNVNRITRWRQDLVMDDWGKYLYIRDDQTAEFWSLSWKPCMPDFDEYECRHGMGYTVLTSSLNDITGKLTVFVPPKDQCEIWLVELRNDGKTKRELSCFTFFEWLLGRWSDSHREFHKLFFETSFNDEFNTITARKRFWDVPNEDGEAWNAGYPYIGFHAVSVEPAGYDCDKEVFIGSYGALASPQAVKIGRSEQTQGKWSDSAASLQVKVSLEPGQTKKIVFMIGMVEENKDITLSMKKYLAPEKAERALAEVKHFWENLIEGLYVETPDKSFDIMNNFWLRYQAISARMWGKAGYYQSSGAIGYRDQLQDSQVFLPINSGWTRNQILLHARHQFTDGVVYHYWDPLTETGPRSHYTDDLLWLPFVTINYLKETADFQIMKVIGSYIDGGDDPLYHHCKKSIIRALERFSPQGLPLIGGGDWNDGMNSVGDKWRGESAWVAEFLFLILKEFIPLAEQWEDTDFVKMLKMRSQNLEKDFNKRAWDGEWYWRATLDSGELLGSKQNKEAKIFLNAQTWAVISGIASPKRAHKAMASAKKQLYKEYGPLLFYPAFHEPRTDIGYLSRYAPGVRENGGLYMHAAIWAIQAECLLENGRHAYDLFSRLCPIIRGMNPDVYKCEPYVTAGNVDGPDSRNFGRGGWTWYTGSAAWLFRVCTEWILGVRPEYNGLRIDPCIPDDWKGYVIVRKFRGDTYRITVKNPDHITCGVKEVILDGKKLKTNLIPPSGTTDFHNVEVIMGKTSKRDSC